MKLVVIGAGVMGRNYLRAAKAAGIPIAGIIDSNAAQAKAAATEYGCDITVEAHDIDAAVVAVPTAAHAAIAGPLLKRGVHCLVEKPFAAAEAECHALMEAAVIGRAVLQVGHIERFNPAIAALFASAIAPETITTLTARRMGPASARVSDVSVIVDLMVHDLDIIIALKSAPVTKVEAAGTMDHAEAALTFADGSIATLTASRTAATRVRDLDVATNAGTYQLDYIAKSLTVNGGAPATFTGDALGAELTDFIDSIRDERQPRVTGAAGLAAMKLAWRVEAALKASA